MDEKKWISFSYEFMKNLWKRKRKKKETLFVALSHLTSVENTFKKMQTFQIHFHFSLIKKYIFL